MFGLARNYHRKNKAGNRSSWTFLTSLLGCVACSGPAVPTDTQPTSVESGSSYTGTKTVDLDEIFEWEGERPQNILMISIDTWRKDGFDYFSNDEDALTPVLNGLVQNAVILENHQSCSSWTYPSVICVMTGTDLLTVGMIPITSATPELVPKGQWLLPGYLKEHGYNTHGVMASNYLCEQNIGSSYDEVECLASLSNELKSATVVREHAVQALASLEKSTAPWFLHLHMYDPHTPLQLPADSLGDLEGLAPLDFVDFSLDEASNSTLSSAWQNMDTVEQEIFLTHLTTRYDALTKLVDKEFGNILAAVEGHGALEDTLVIFWADHGEAMFDRNRYGHGITLYQEESDVMAMYYSPNLKNRGWEKRTVHQDIAPTLLEAVGLPVPAELTGRVVGSRTNEESIFSYLRKADTFQVSATRGSFRMHYDWKSGEKELFRLDKDPLETNNVYNSQHPVVGEIWEELDLIISRIDELVDVKGPTDAYP